MQRVMGGILIALLLVCAGTAMAGEQGDSPAILASLQTSDNVVTLDDESMDRIEGTFFCLPKEHPSLQEAVCTLFGMEPESRWGWLQDTFYSHKKIIEMQLINCLCPGFKPGNGIGNGIP